jgi:hypothetical protein
VYVAGGDGYLYALSARNLSVVWKSVIAIPSATPGPGQVADDSDQQGFLCSPFT